MKYDFDALKGIFDGMPDNAVDTALSVLNSHKRIFVYGAGRSGLMLKAFAMRLAQAGRTVYVVGETITPAIEKADLLILASASGKTSSVLKYAQTATEVGADIFVITATESSPLTEYPCTRVILPSPTKDSVTSSIMGTLFEQSVLLFCDLTVRNLNEDASAMRARHANLE